MMPITTNRSARLCFFAIAFFALQNAYTTNCFSVPSSSAGRKVEDQINRIKSIIIDSNTQQLQEEQISDASTIPITQIQNEPGSNIVIECVSYASDFLSTTKLSASEYDKFTTSRNTDCINLFDNYNTNLIRCEKISDQSINIRWNATWIPSGSTWLYNLGEFAGWEINVKSPDPTVISTFSWKAVFATFSNAFATGTITLPISCVEGNTILTIKQVQDEIDSVAGNSFAVTIKESIDLVSEADKNRLQNRRVAQELASWLDVSRRPPKYNVDDWAGMVRQRILTSVPGAGALDVDPNESDAEGVVALVLFGFISVVVLGLSFQFFLPELVGGTASIPARCDDAEILEFGSGYLSECFGPFGDPTLETK